MNAAHRPSGHDRTAADAAQPRVALYTSGNQPSTLDRQEAALRRYLTTHQPQWRIVAVYRDVAPTGGWRAIRPGLRHALHAAASGMFDLVLVHRLDRLSRRVEDLEPLVERLDAASVAVRTVTEPFDSAAPGSRLILRLRAAFAAHERQVDRERRNEERLAARHGHPFAASAGHPDPTPPSALAATAIPAAAARLELTANPAAPEVPMNRIIREIDRGTRTVNGVQVHITELVWHDEGRSFEVHRTDTGADLTEDGCFDTWPTDDQIADLLGTAQDLWSCPGCGATVDASQADLVADHVRDCDRVDGAGQPVRRGAR